MTLHSGMEITLKFKILENTWYLTWKEKLHISIHLYLLTKFKPCFPGVFHVLIISSSQIIIGMFSYFQIISQMVEVSQLGNNI